MVKTGMPKIDVYLRSVERFGASGAILTSGQAVTLRFPTGDRNATQITPHDQLVTMVREIAPPPVLDQIDRSRPARFEIDSNGIRYAISVTPRAGTWQVGIDPAPPPTAPAPAATIPGVAFTPTPRPATSPAAASAPAPSGADDMLIERGQYDGPQAVPSTSGSGFLDQLTHAARAARATDIYLATGMTPVQRVGGELAPAGGGALDREVLSRELGVVAPADARAAWSEQGTATFTYSDGSGRVRVTLARDHRGPSAALRLLPDEPPALERAGLPAQAAQWLGAKGLVLVAGPSGSGKTVMLASLVRALGEKRRRVIAIEDPIEIVHASAWISQRAVGEHVADVAAGVASAMTEGADAIAIGRVASAASALALVDAVAGGHLVLAAINAPPDAALDRVLAQLPSEQRAVAQSVLGSALLGTVQARLNHSREAGYKG